MKLRVKSELTLVSTYAHRLRSPVPTTTVIDVPIHARMSAPLATLASNLGARDAASRSRRLAFSLLNVWRQVTCHAALRRETLASRRGETREAASAPCRALRMSAVIIGAAAVILLYC